MWIDYIIISIIIISALMSMIKGFVHEILSLLSWICAFFVTSHFYTYVSIYFIYFREQIVRNLIAIILLFVITIIFGAIVKNITASLIKKTCLSGVDHTLGFCFGTIRGILIISIFLLFIVKFTSFSYNHEWKKSQLIPKFIKIIRYF